MMKELKSRICKYCSAEFFSLAPNKKFCSPLCFKHRRRKYPTSTTLAKPRTPRMKAKRPVGIRHDPEYQRSSQRKRRYGLTTEEFAARKAMQGGKCAICQGPPSGRGVDFHVDHCHETHKVRGLLCHHCNIGLGNFKDRVDLLQAAQKYLNE